MQSFGERVKKGKLDPLSKMGKSKLTGREISNYYKSNPSAKKAAKDKTVKNAIELALDLGGALNYAIKQIEKLKKGMSKNPEVKKALQFANEEVEVQEMDHSNEGKKLEALCAAMKLNPKQSSILATYMKTGKINAQYTGKMAGDTKETRKYSGLKNFKEMRKIWNENK